MASVFEGERKGLAEGEQKGRLEVARKMKTMGLSTNQIATATGLSLDEIEK